MRLGWYIYMYSLVLAIVSYLFCILTTWRKKRISLTDFLFEGNNYVISTFSILGSVFSVAVFFTAITALYILFGTIVLPATLIPALIGFYLLRRKHIEIFTKSSKLNFDSISDFSVYRYRFIIESIGKPTQYYVYLMSYLFLMTITEIAAFNNIINVFVPHNSWSPLIIYIVVFTVLAYIYISGFRSVLVTDSLQTLIMVLTLIFMLYAVISRKITYDFEKLFLLPRIGDTILILIGAFIMCLAWFSTSPEIWIRIITLRKNGDFKKTITYSMIFLPLVIALPFAIIMFSGVYPKFTGNSTEAFNVWQNIFQSTSSLIPALFLVLIITAFFTTIDTYNISYSQILYTIQGRNILEKFLPKNIRKSSIIFVLVCMIIGVRLSPNINAVLGVYAGCLVIPLFMLSYIYPYLKQKNIIPSITNISLYLQIAAAFFILGYMLKFVKSGLRSHLCYPLIPICLASVEILGLFTNFIFNYMKKRRKNSEVEKSKK